MKVISSNSSRRLREHGRLPERRTSQLKPELVFPRERASEIKDL